MEFIKNQNHFLLLLLGIDLRPKHKSRLWIQFFYKIKKRNEMRQTTKKRAKTILKIPFKFIEIPVEKSRFDFQIY